MRIWSANETSKEQRDSHITTPPSHLGDAAVPLWKRPRKSIPTYSKVAEVELTDAVHRCLLKKTNEVHQSGSEAMLDQLEDGSHEITLRNIQCHGCEAYPDASGTLRWHPDRGATFCLRFNGIRTLSATPYYRAAGQVSNGVGRFIGSDNSNPTWVAETDNGTRVSLYVMSESEMCTSFTGTNGSGVRCETSGSVRFAVVDIPDNRMLAFKDAAEEGYRMFFSGHTGERYHEAKAITYEDSDGAYTTTTRGSVILANSPRVSLTRSYAACQPSGWLGFEEPPVESDCEMGAFSEQSFVSFIHGRRVAFHWADKKQDDVIRRTYFGWVKAKTAGLDEPDQQPLPFLGGVEVFAYGEEVLENLPSLFRSYVERFTHFNFTETMLPMWTALGQDIIFTDRLALLSISLERTATYWKRCRDAVLDGAPASNQSVWKNKAVRKTLRRNLKERLDELLPCRERKKECLHWIVEEFGRIVCQFVSSNACQSLSEKDKQELKKVVLSNIDNCTAPPNSFSLQVPFKDLQIDLSPKEEEALRKRNDALHGQQCDGSDLVALDDEAEHCDCMRMLITKFVLRLCGYEGPYIDYASRPASGNFVVKRMGALHQSDSHRDNIQP